MPPASSYIVSVHRPPQRSFATALGLAVVATPTFAQDAAESLRLPTLNVEAVGGGYKAEEASSPKFAQPLLDTPRSVTVVPEQVMEERGATSLQDVFRNVSGISLAAGEGGVPAGDNLTLRGFSARTDIFVDGMRDFGTYFRDPFNLEAVEVIKGPASAYAGRGATGGAINLVTKSPRLEDFSAAAVTLGTDQTKRVTADLNRELEGLGEGAAVRLNLMAHDAEVAGRDEVEQQRWGIAPSLSLGLGTPTRMTFRGLFQKQDNVPDYGHPFLDGRPAPVDRDNWYGLRDLDDDNVETATASFRLEHDLSDAVTVRNQLSYGRTTHDSIVTAPRISDTTLPGTVDRGSPKTRDSKDTILSNQTDLSWAFATGRVRHTLVTGVELVREESKNRGRTFDPATLPPADLANPDPGTPYTGTITRAAEASEATAKSVAVYAFDTVELNERWELTGGLRWDRFEVEHTPAGRERLERTDSEVSWNVGAVYKPRPNGSIYAAYGTSFNPSAEGLTLTQGRNQTPLADVEPEESRTFEIGTKWDLLHRRLGLTAAIFRTDKTNARTSGNEAVGEPPIVLEGEQRVDGIELSLTGRISERWQMLAGYTFLDSEIGESNDADEVGKAIPNVPEHTFTLWTTYQPIPKLEVGAGAQYVSSRYANATNTNKVPDYWLFDAMASYRVNNNVLVRLNVYNLTDEDYYDAIYSGHAVPGAGRSALLATAFEF